MLNLNIKPRLSGEWEMFLLAPDLVVFQGAGGRQIQVKRGATIAQLLVENATGYIHLGALLDMVSNLTGKTAEAVSEVLNNLLAKKILVNHHDERPQWISSRQWVLQQNLLESFISSERPLEDRLCYLRRLVDATVVVIGIGGSGAMTAFLLAAAGVRHLRLVDPDVVELSNLGRQFLYQEADIGTYKVESLAARIKSYDPEVLVETHQQRVDSFATARDVLTGCSFAIITGDEPRLLLQRWVDEAARELYVPYLRALYDWYGPMFIPGASPCFACLEAQWRLPKGNLYEQLCTTPSLRPCFLPATPWGIVGAAAAYAEEVVGYLTKAWTPHSLGAQVKWRGTSLIRIPVMPDAGCYVCNSGKSS